MFPEGRLFEFLIVGAVALMVVGPKDLPILMRKVGQFIARMRGMAAEFRASFDELARQSELDELRREVEALRSANPMRAAADATGLGDVRTTFDDINASLSASETPLHSPLAYTPLAEPERIEGAPEPEPPTQPAEAPADAPAAEAGPSKQAGASS